MKNLKRNVDGITLIALVITIIVLLILAGISIAMLTGENGILTKANDAKNKTQLEDVKEQAKLDILAEHMGKEGGGLLDTELKGILDKYFKDVPDIKENADMWKEFPKNFPALHARDEYGGEKLGDIDISEIYDGDIEKAPELASETEDYVGYYADLDGNTENGAEGIIYADLAKGSDGEKKWNSDSWAVFKYPTDGENGGGGYKKYVVEEQQGSGFGTWKKPMIKVTTGGGTTDRFYVMALRDVTIDGTTVFTWYKNGNSKLNKHSEAVETSVNDFGKGKDNTKYWMKDEHSSEYGGLTDGDMWKAIKDELNNNGLEWFVPSKSEWSAFGDMCYTKMGLLPINYHIYRTFKRLILVFYAL